MRFLYLQLYEINDDPKRKEFLDDLFSFMQKRGESIVQSSGGNKSKSTSGATGVVSSNSASLFATV